MTHPGEITRQAIRTPRAAAVAGIAFAGLLTTAMVLVHMAAADLTGVGEAAAGPARRSISGAIQSSQGLPGRLRDTVMGAANAAFLSGMRLALLTAAGIAIVGAAFAARRIPAGHALATKADAEDSPSLEDAPPAAADVGVTIALK
jgi:hypothetical protein